MFILLLVVLAGLFVVRAWIRRKQIEAVARKHPPGSGRHGLAMGSLLIVMVATVVAKITDNLWWLLLGLPGVVMALYVEHKRRQTEKSGADA